MSLTPLYLIAAAAAAMIAVSFVVIVETPPPPSAKEIGSEVVRQESEILERSRDAAQFRKSAMRCDMPGYEACR